MPGGNFTRNTAEESASSIARKMFFGGCFGLPWLWAGNVWFYRKHLWGSPGRGGVDGDVQYCKSVVWLGVLLCMCRAAD